MKHTFTLFSDYFALRDNWLTRFDPRVKVLAVLVVIVAVVLSRQALLPAGVLLGCLGCLWSVRVPARVVLVRMAPVALVVAVLVLLRGVAAGPWPWAAGAGGPGAAAPDAGLREGLLIGSRVAGAMAAVMLSSFITPAPQFYATLRWLRAPALWVELAALVYRYVFVILERAGSTVLAQRARLGYVGPRRALQSIGILAGTVFLRAFEQAEGTHRAMCARGYNGTLPTVALAPLGRRRAVALAGFGAGVAALYRVCERMVGT